MTEKRIKHDILLRQVLDELFEYRANLGMVFCYDWVSIPLVYTQTVTIATYMYFFGMYFPWYSNNSNNY